MSTMQKKALNVTEGSASEIVEGRMSDGDTDRVTATPPPSSSWDVLITNDDDDDGDDDNEGVGDDNLCDETWVSDSTDMLIVSNMQVSVAAVTCPQLYFDRT